MTCRWSPYAGHQRHWPDDRSAAHPLSWALCHRGCRSGKSLHHPGWCLERRSPDPAGSITVLRRVDPRPTTVWWLQEFAPDCFSCAFWRYGHNWSKAGPVPDLRHAFVPILPAYRRQGRHAPFDQPVNPQGIQFLFGLPVWTKWSTVIRPFIRNQSQPGEGFMNVFLGAGNITLLIRIFNPKNESTPMFSGK